LRRSRIAHSEPLDPAIVSIGEIQHLR